MSLNEDFSKSAFYKNNFQINISLTNIHFLFFPFPKQKKLPNTFFRGFIHWGNDGRIVQGHFKPNSTSDAGNDPIVQGIIIPFHEYIYVYDSVNLRYLNS